MEGIINPVLLVYDKDKFTELQKMTPADAMKKIISFRGSSQP